MYASAQYLKERRQSPEVAALLQLASLLGVSVTGLERSVPAASPAPILFAVMTPRSRCNKAVSLVLDYDLCQTARLARIGYQTRSWFVVYSPGKVFQGGYFADPKTGLLAVAGPVELFRLCSSTLRLLTVTELQNIRTHGACSKARRLRHRLESSSYNGALKNELQTFLGDSAALQLLPAVPSIAGKAAASRALDQILRNCKRPSNG